MVAITTSRPLPAAAILVRAPSPTMFLTPSVPSEHICIRLALENSYHTFLFPYDYLLAAVTGFASSGFSAVDGDSAAVTVTGCLEKLASFFLSLLKLSSLQLLSAF